MRIAFRDPLLNGAPSSRLPLLETMDESSLDQLTRDQFELMLLSRNGVVGSERTTHVSLPRNDTLIP